MIALAEAAFRVRDVSYRYHQVPALTGLSMQVATGERVALLGANGSGKSTLLRLLAGLSFPEAGGISFFGQPVTERNLQEEAFFFSFRRRVGLVFQNPDVQLFNPSVFDEVAFGPLQLRWPKAQIREKVEAALESMGISHLRDRAPHRLSGGEKKRVALASVLVTDPEVLLLDEPSAALDPMSQAQIIALLKSWKNGVKTVITATHGVTILELLYVGDDNGVLHKFSGVFLGTPVEVTTGGWPITLAGKLTSPVIDPNSGSLFVGSSNGRLYQITTPSGTPGTGIYSAVIANGTGIVDSPVADASDYPNASVIYVFVGDQTGTARSAVYQFSPTFTGAGTDSGIHNVNMGSGTGEFDAHRVRRGF